MHIMTFSERPYFDVPEDEIIANGSSYFGLPNTFVDPVKGGQLYNEYLDERIYAEELGFDGVMLNEHHQTPFCMGSVMDVEAAVLARITKKVKIVLLGNPLPVADPLRLAEELAMIDMISGGRLVPGLVRGAGSEQIANNINPAYNRERFNEAHDFIVKAWTTPGPLALRGQAFPLSLRESVAVADSETASANLDPRTDQPRDRGVVRRASLSVRRAMHQSGADGRAVKSLCGYSGADGLSGGTGKLRYLQNVVVAETEEKATELGRGFVYGGGFGSFARPEWMFPPGYNSKEATKRLAKQFTDPRTGAEILHFTPGEVDVQKIKARSRRTTRRRATWA